MSYKILIMGLSGSGKTTLAKKLVEKFSSVLWINADEVRKTFNDWDFSKSGRIRQSTRMASIANDSECDYVVCDFIAPLPEHRKIFDADYTIWMNTITYGRFDDTNELFVPPSSEYDYVIESFDDIDISIIAKTAINLNI